MIPFTTEQFLNVFERYNVDVWPAQIFLFAIAWCALALALRRTAGFGRSINGILAFLWLWSGAVYHWLYFSTINKLAIFFGALFIFQASLFIYAGVSGKLSFRFRLNTYGLVGALFFVYALFIYPVLGYYLGHRYPLAPTLGVPCPITIFTFGMFLWAERKFPLYLMIVPLSWSLIAVSAALSLRMFEDFGLLAASLIGWLLVVLRNRNAPRLRESIIFGSKNTPSQITS